MTASTPAHSRMVQRSPVFYGWIVWFVGTLGMIATSPGQSYSVSLFIDFFIDEFDMTRTSISGLYGLGTFIGALSLTFVGRQIDRFGNRRAGVVISLGFALVLALWWPVVSGPAMLLIGFIGIRMLGQGSLTLVSSTAIAQWFWHRRGRVMSLTAVFFAVARGLWVPGLQQLLKHMAWRQVFVLLGVSVGTVIPVLFWVFMRDRPEDFGLVPDGDSADAGESDESAPVEDNWTLREAMRTPLFWIFLTGRLILPTWITGLVFHQVSVFESLGYSAETAAATYGAMSFVTAGLSIGAGLLIDRYRSGLIMAANMLALCVTISMATIMTEPWMLWIYAAAYGTTMAFGIVFDGAVWANLFGRAHQGTIRGFVSTVLVAGTSFGPILFGFSYDYLGGYNPILYVGASLTLIPLTLSLFLDRPQRRPDPTIS